MQLNHLNKAKTPFKRVRIDFSAAAIKDMVKNGGIFPLLTAISALIAAATPAVAKASAFGAVGIAAGMALKKVTGKGYKKERIRSKTTKNSSLMVSKTLAFLPLSNFDLLDAVKRLRIKHFRGVFMQDQLPQQPNNPESRITNLDYKNGPGTHWVAYTNEIRGIVYFSTAS